MERMVLEHVRHPHIVASRFFKKVGKTHCVGMELLKGGSVNDHLNRNRDYLPEVRT